ncbi:MAG: hypothetical protein PF694_13140 [Bacteroidetes bacterium]|nr:hypothetical protein [Bacteroidota bacterium]
MPKYLPLKAVVALFLFLVLVSCNKFEGDQTVPAYIRIDTISVNTDYFSQGSNTHRITDAWVYVNDQLIGAFELPATIPVLARGRQKLEIRPGIKLNGIGGTRVPYPFYQPYIVTDYNFIEDSIRSILPVTSYYNTITFAWLEDFEGSSISLEKTSQSDTSIYQTSPINNPEAYLSDFSSYSGIVNLTTEKNSFKLSSFNAFILPGLGSPVMLEVDYKCTQSFGVGMFAEISGTIVDIPLIVVNKSEKWNKIYINLGPNVSTYTSASNFKIYFESSMTGEDDAQYYFDNIKLIYRSNN